MIFKPKGFKYFTQMKRKLSEINTEFIKSCKTNFLADKSNIIARNAIVTVGSFNATMNSAKTNQVNHVFLNSVKKRNIKATNQGNSGRCWMFAALNTFRHILIKALDLRDFEFSEVYLFFWDKFERANSYLTWFIEHPEYKPEDREFEYILKYHLNDGGWWNTFANLVDKYGIVPSTVMKETYQSNDTNDMNEIIKERLDSCVNKIYQSNVSAEIKNKWKRDTLENVYNILVKFLGEPPETFEWGVRTENDEMVISDLTPCKFRDMVTTGISMHNFITLSHVPIRHLEMNQLYRIKWTNNVVGGKDCTLLNMNPHELSKYAIKSITAGFAVWFAGDVRKHFNYLHSTLDDAQDDSDLVFGKPYKFSKGDRLTLGNTEGNHAMALTGVNLDHKGRPVSWQVENSWGYWDHETPGMDGFLTMSHSWFEKYVIEIVVNKKFLSRSVKKLLNKEPIILNPWDSMAPATKAGNVDPPKWYRGLFKKEPK